jgi:hypothetical protein
MAIASKNTVIIKNLTIGKEKEQQQMENAKVSSLMIVNLIRNILGHLTMTIYSFSHFSVSITRNVKRLTVAHLLRAFMINRLTWNL